MYTCQCNPFGGFKVGKSVGPISEFLYNVKWVHTKAKFILLDYLNFICISSSLCSCENKVPI